MAASQNDYDAAAELSDESLRIGTETKDVEAVAWSLIEGAIPRWMDGDIAAVTERFESALSLARLMGVEQAEVNALQTLCGILITSGDLNRAVELGKQSLAMSKDRGELWARGYTLNFLAQAYWLRGDRRHGEELAREAAQCKHAVDDRNGLSVTLETLAWMAAEPGQHERAAHLLGAAERVRDESSLTLIELFRAQHDRSVAAAVRGLGQGSFDTAFARGQAMTIDEGVAFAVEGTRPPKPAPGGYVAAYEFSPISAARAGPSPGPRWPELQGCPAKPRPGSWSSQPALRLSPGQLVRLAERPYRVCAEPPSGTGMVLDTRAGVYEGPGSGCAAASRDRCPAGFSGRASKTAPTVTAAYASTRRPPSAPLRTGSPRTIVPAAIGTALISRRCPSWASQ
jgi:hypothetical protein